MPSRWRAALTVALLAVLATTAGPAHALTDAGAGPRQTAPQEDSRATSLLVELRADGDARWTVTATFNLTTHNETEAFRDLAAAFESGETSALGLDAFRRASARASETTAREMSITDVSRRASPESVIDNGTGRLELSFTWTNFGRVEGDRLTVGDAFTTQSGTWLPGLTANQTLVVRPPPGFGVVNASVAPRNGSLRWTGPTTLPPGSLSATFTGDQAGPTPGAGITSPISTLGAGLLTLAAGAVFAYLLVRRRRGPADPRSTGPGPAPDADPTDDNPPSEPTSRPPSTESGDGAAAGEPDDADEELLSDEERVERLLAENGGRMKQANIVKETGWSNAKVSQLLSAMAEDDRIDKLRIGRENLISFPDDSADDS